MKLTLDDIKSAAARLKCEPAAIAAVDKVESGGAGFVGTEPIVLFEPHVFWKRLRAHGLDPQKLIKDHPEYSEFLYPVWGTKPYPEGQRAKRAVLDKASQVHREAALESASWGRYQILGMNWSSCGCSTLQEFINKIYLHGEKGHLDLFVEYVLTNHLDDELREKDFAGFARGYNGSLYAKNRYDVRLQHEFIVAKSLMEHGVWN